MKITGLLDVLKEGAGLVKESMEQRRERIMHYKEMLESRSDDELNRIFHNATGEKKVAAGLLLRERGYTTTDD